MKTIFKKLICTSLIMAIILSTALTMGAISVSAAATVNDTITLTADDYYYGVLTEPDGDTPGTAYIAGVKKEKAIIPSSKANSIYQPYIIDVPDNVKLSSITYTEADDQDLTGCTTYIKDDNSTNLYNVTDIGRGAFVYTWALLAPTSGNTTKVGDSFNNGALNKTTNTVNTGYFCLEEITGAENLTNMGVTNQYKGNTVETYLFSYLGSNKNKLVIPTAVTGTLYKFMTNLNSVNGNSDHGIKEVDFSNVTELAQYAFNQGQCVTKVTTKAKVISAADALNQMGNGGDIDLYLLGDELPEVTSWYKLLNSMRTHAYNSKTNLWWDDDIEVFVKNKKLKDKLIELAADELASNTQTDPVKTKYLTNYLPNATSAGTTFVPLFNEKTVGFIDTTVIQDIKNADGNLLYGLKYSVNGSNPENEATLEGFVVDETNNYPSEIDLVVPATVSDANGTYNVHSIADDAFKSVTSAVKTLTIEEGVKNIGAEAFWDNQYLIWAKIPSTVSNINTKALGGCDALNDVWIEQGDGQTSLAMGSQVFHDCQRLRSVTYPARITSIAGEQFSSCNRLTSVTILGDITDTSPIATTTHLKNTNIRSVYNNNRYYVCTDATYNILKNKWTDRIKDAEGNETTDAFGNIALYTGEHISNGVIQATVTAYLVNADANYGIWAYEAGCCVRNGSNWVTDRELTICSPSGTHASKVALVRYADTNAEEKVEQVAFENIAADTNMVSFRLADTTGFMKDRQNFISNKAYKAFLWEDVSAANIKPIAKSVTMQ